MSEEEQHNEDSPRRPEEKPDDNVISASETKDETTSSRELPQETEQLQTINNETEREDMEVHHHTHAGHGKKTWKNYFWEFLMLFLAVFCGFLAEYQLEHIIEHQREKEFIISMFEDAKTDTANISKVIKVFSSSTLAADSLITLCYNYDGTSKSDIDIYRLWRKMNKFYDVMNPAERTLSQLKNAGGMRLLRKKAAVNSIIQYEDAGKQLKDQEMYVDRYNKEAAAITSDIMNFNNYIAPDYTGVKNGTELLTHDKIKLIQLGNRIIAIRGSSLGYSYRLEKMREQAVKLMNTLRKEYNLSDE